LSVFKTLNIIKYKNELGDISETATKQYANETMMSKMRSEWAPLEFSCTIPQGKDTFILSGEAVESIQTVLDDHIIKA